MAQPADEILEDAAIGRPADYEQPLTERLRTFLRLEFLYRQTRFHAATSSVFGSRAAIQSLLEITAILGRGDVRSEALKELERQIDIMRRYKTQPGVDLQRLNQVLASLEDQREGLRGLGPHYLQALKDSAFLSAIKHRSAIPGGTCEFDLPDYSFWLRQPYEIRRETLDGWLASLSPLLDTVSELMWLTREAVPAEERIAENGMYQYNVSREIPCRLLRVRLPAGEDCYPEISGGQHRFTIRFMEWSDSDQKATQVSRDVAFALSLC